MRKGKFVSSPLLAKAKQGQRLPPHSLTSLFAMVKGWTLRPGSARAWFHSSRPSDRHAIGLSYSLRRIDVNGLVDCFYRFRHGMSQPPSRGRQRLTTRGPSGRSSRQHGGSRSGLSGWCYLRQARAPSGEQAPRRQRIFPGYVVVTRAFWSCKKPTGIYK
jgi:hypothetical protein